MPHREASESDWNPPLFISFVFFTCEVPLPFFTTKGYLPNLLKGTLRVGCVRRARWLVFCFVLHQGKFLVWDIYVLATSPQETATFLPSFNETLSPRGKLQLSLSLNNHKIKISQAHVNEIFCLAYTVSRALATRLFVWRVILLSISLLLFDNCNHTGKSHLFW